MIVPTVEHDTYDAFRAVGTIARGVAILKLDSSVVQ
jgi:hypothetical protein